ncbi:YciI family protein [Marinicella litoralis]|uniref:Uncharacterized protein YciI n=1 Tax=Marinicella litoralis TaxID=644220 RepID=A0A4R6Y1C2_9GAMM|nr:YciI family protein [Marinicella litoralis]TDR22758.1 uncharacterized protein YciI [Marinicella litoralis]
MKTLVLISLSLISFNALSESKKEQQSPIFNAELAEHLGADDYGMKMYVMAFLKKGPNRDQSAEEVIQLQQAHMANIKRMAEAGDLVMAGPFGNNDLGMRGIYIFNVTTIEAAKALTATDPAIQAGSLVMELIPWYGSAALMQVNEIGATLAKKSF